MSRSHKAWWVVASIAAASVLGGAAWLGCGEAEHPRAEPQPILPHPRDRVKLERPEPSAEELPVPEDFEAEAGREITRANYKSELNALEREIKAGAH